MSDLFKPTVHVIGPGVVEHDMPCPVCGTNHAVCYVNTGVFYPCRSCESRGWTLARPKRWQERVMRLIGVKGMVPRWT